MPQPTKKSHFTMVISDFICQRFPNLLKSLSDLESLFYAFHRTLS